MARRSTRPQSLYRMVALPPAVAEQVQRLVEAHATDLYTGISTSLDRRAGQHANDPAKAPWLRDVAVIVPEHLTPGITRRAAETQERRRIAERSPWFNKKDNPGGFRWDMYRRAQARHAQAFGIRRSWWARHNPFPTLTARAATGAAWAGSVLVPGLVGTVAGFFIGAAVMLSQLGAI